MGISNYMIRFDIIINSNFAWEYRVHVAGYGWFESCDTANLNYGEIWGTIIKRALGG